MRITPRRPGPGGELMAAIVRIPHASRSAQRFLRLLALARRFLRLDLLQLLGLEVSYLRQPSGFFFCRLLGVVERPEALDDHLLDDARPDCVIM
jgi:hypothetical protein